MEAISKLAGLITVYLWIQIIFSFLFLVYYGITLYRINKRQKK